MKIRVDCRRTGAGAYTAPERMIDDNLVDVEFNQVKIDRSKTGRHWSVEVDIPTSHFLLVADISGKGHHYCYCIDSNGNKYAQVNEHGCVLHAETINRKP